VRVRGKIALVTGSARGIGLATARLLQQQGATVILSDINNLLGEQSAKQLAGSCSYQALDVSCEADWQRVAEVIQREYGCLDILVNNAGISGLMETKGPHDPEHLDLESWHQVHATNLDGVALGCKYGIQLMRSSSSASIVNISSRSGLVGIPAASAYASSKAAVRNHTKSVALYCAEQGYPIRCNSIHPGAILTPMWESMLGEGGARDEAIERVASEIPLKRMGDAEDVAYGVLYLASDESRYVTGTELNIDGGILAGSLARP